MLGTLNKNFELVIEPQFMKFVQSKLWLPQHIMD